MALSLPAVIEPDGQGPRDPGYRERDGATSAAAGGDGADAG